MRGVSISAESANGCAKAALDVRFGVGLAAYVARVEAAGQPGVGCAFNNCAAVGKEGHLVWFFPESKDEFIPVHIAVGFEALA